jgi:hypothetical protein
MLVENRARSALGNGIPHAPGRFTLEGEPMEPEPGPLRPRDGRRTLVNEAPLSAPGDSYCGIYCGACSILRRAETGRGDAFTACLAGVPEKDLACGGCKSDARYAGCRVCQFRDCAVAKGVEHCVECSDYPCKAYRAWQSLAAILPHVRESPANLEAIRQRGVEAWLESQAKRWSCPICGARFSWYADRCGRCGRGLDAEAHALSRARRLLCAWLLPRAYRKGVERGA